MSQNYSEKELYKIFQEARLFLKKAEMENIRNLQKKLVNLSFRTATHYLDLEQLEELSEQTCCAITMDVDDDQPTSEMNEQAAIQNESSAKYQKLLDCSSQLEYLHMRYDANRLNTELQTLTKEIAELKEIEKAEHLICHELQTKLDASCLQSKADERVAEATLKSLKDDIMNLELVIAEKPIILSAINSKLDEKLPIFEKLLKENDINQEEIAKLELETTSEYSIDFHNVSI